MASSTQLPQTKVYFPNLNAIRFIAAFLVIIHHVEQFKSMLHIKSSFDNKIILLIGELGVVLFFVLSGFLISFLLYKEQEITKTISIKDFYIRRILRIWPLYFLIIILAFFILPFNTFFTIDGFDRGTIWNNLCYKLILFVFFLPNLVWSLYGFIPYASQTWSIAAEEQFYLIWPYLNKKINNKWALLIGVIFIYLVIKIMAPFVVSKTYVDTFNSFWASTPIDCMAIGGLFALVIHEKSAITNNLQKIIFNKIVQWIVLALTIFLIAGGVHFSRFTNEIYAVLFGILICNFAFNANRIFSMENPVSIYLGKISYGLYMFHPIAIVACIRLLEKNNMLSDFILYPLALTVSIAISALSYQFFEKRFISKKVKYSKLLSGDNAKN